MEKSAIPLTDSFCDPAKQPAGTDPFLLIEEFVGLLGFGENIQPADLHFSCGKEAFQFVFDFFLSIWNGLTAKIIVVST